VTLLGGIEAGGTKVVCAVGASPGAILERTVIPTTTPTETLARVAAWFVDRPIDALGVASFGPLDLDPSSDRYGHITSTTKPGWAGTDIAGYLRETLGVPVTLDTDVNGAAYGEYRCGAGLDTGTLVYVTVGTGIGGGAIVDGTALHGLLHPEMGHLPVRRHPDDTFPGSCPFHGDCIEGMASGPAIARRTGCSPAELGPDALPRVIEFEAHYLAQLMAAIVYLLSPHRVVLGGGVLNLPGLIARVRQQTTALIGDALPAMPAKLDDYLVLPALGPHSGVVGALALASRRHEQRGAVVTG
jgi:fructokinase